MTISCLGIGIIFQPMVEDNLRLTASLTLLNRRRFSFGKSLKGEVGYKDVGKLNLRSARLDIFEIAQL